MLHAEAKKIKGKPMKRKPMKGKFHRPEPQFALDYVATQSDLREMKAELKGDITSARNELKGDIATVRNELKGDIATVRTELKGDIKDLEIKMLTTMATKAEMRMLIGGLYLLMVIGFSALTYLGLGGK